MVEYKYFCFYFISQAQKVIHNAVETKKLYQCRLRYNRLNITNSRCNNDRNESLFNVLIIMKRTVNLEIQYRAVFC